MNVVKNGDDTDDPIAGICRDQYRADGLCLEEAGWTMIAETVAESLVPGEDFLQFMGRLEPHSEDDPDQVIDRDKLQRLYRVTDDRQEALAIVAPEVLRACTSALAEHWTVDELATAVKEIAWRYGPRLQDLVEHSKG